MTPKRAGKKNLTGGIVFHAYAISLVLAGDGGGDKSTGPIKWAHIPVPEKIDIENDQFVSFLKATIEVFFGGHKNVHLWSAVESRNFKMRNILVPDLPESKLPNAAFWGLKKETELDADVEAFDYHVIGTVREDGHKKKNLLAYSGLKTEIEALRNLFVKAGYPLTGITAIPFALQNFAWSGMMGFPEGLVTIVHVARNQTDITCFYKSNLQLVRTIRTGSRSLVEDFHDGSDNPDVFEFLASGTGQDSSDFSRIENGAGRLVSKVLRTGEYCSQNYAENKSVEQYLFFGDTDNSRAFMAYAADQISSEVRLFTPGEALGHQTFSPVFPDSAEERSGIIPALGLALSNKGKTPNFLDTYVQRNTQAKFRKINTLILWLWLVAVLACSGFWWRQELVKRTETVELKKIKAQVANYVPEVNGEILNQAIQKSVARTRAVKRYALDYLPLAVINEFSSLTPESISLVSLEADFRQTLPDKRVGPDKEKNGPSVSVTGIVTGAEATLESVLTGYLIMLDDSPVFGEIRIIKKNTESKGDSSVLKFTAEMDIL